MARLSLPPSSPAFPHASVLHAICALASIYTLIVTDIEKINLDDGKGIVVANAGVFQRTSHGLGRIFRNNDKDDEKAFDFAKSHLRWGREAFHRALNRGEPTIEQVQGFDTSSAYSTLSRIPAEYLYACPPALSPTDEEMRRNIFWVAYAMERLVNATNTWTLSFEDMDCSQLLPCRLKDFTSGIAVPKQTRQHLLSRDMLVTHPSLSTDSFTLYVKAAIIFGQVRTFNRRYNQHYDALNTSGSESTPASKAKLKDPRETKEFKALDELIGAFVASIPREFKDPLGLNPGTKLDSTLYVAHLLPYMAMITLHDPHANVSFTQDSSAQKLLAAARGILGLIYDVCSTAFDLLYLDHISSTAWFIAGTTLIRFLAAKTAQGDEAEVAILKEELGAVK
ncbi:hypothetical protein FRB96_005924 [Tulasnella sp. 330]|nr:hypothetical protein FRB96_005924 [Tulasnella sp. 330]